MQEPPSTNRRSLTATSGAVFLTLLAALFTQACTTAVYSGPRLPHTQLAIVRSSGAALFNGVTIYAVDDQQFAVPRRGVELAPGEHHLRVGMDYQRSGDDARPIEFTALAGRNYVILTEEERPGLRRFWIEDRSNGKTVGD